MDTYYSELVYGPQLEKSPRNLFSIVKTNASSPFTITMSSPICEHLDDLTKVARKMSPPNDSANIDSAAEVVKTLCTYCDNPEHSKNHLCKTIRNYKIVDVDAAPPDPSLASHNDSLFHADTCHGRGYGKDCNQPANDTKNTEYCQKRKKEGLGC